MKDLSFRSPPSLAINIGATTPTASVGTIIWSSTENKNLFWDGDTWEALGSGSGSSLVMSDTPPPASATTLWFDTNNGTFNVYYDGNWIESSGSAGRGIVSFAQTAGTSAPGTLDTYTFTYSDGTTSSFQVYNGDDAIGGSGDVDGPASSVNSTFPIFSGTTGKILDSQPAFGYNYTLESGTYQVSLLTVKHTDTSNVVSGLDFRDNTNTSRATFTYSKTGGSNRILLYSSLDVYSFSETQIQFGTPGATYTINTAGAFGPDGSYGSSGQVFTSAGSSAAPSWTTLTKSSVGLANVDNTPDSDKPISTATQTALDGKEPTITKSTGYAKWNGSAWSFVNETYVQTSEIGSTVQAYSANLAAWSGVATSAKQDTLVSGTSIKTINGASVLGSGNVAVGDVVGPASAIDTQVAVFDGTTGKLLKTIPLYAVQISPTIATLSSIDAIVISASTKSIAIVSNGELQVNGSPGTSGQVLTSGGPGAEASWQTPSGGGDQITVSATAPSSPTLNQLWLDIS